ncbi:MAG: dockerin type I repeat-containing protein [Clostridia bacterium]|nr:dockerin type I repeat-containing protein [Clostridia bacterium]MBR4799726.1 dockerin type I repeat-containing protein [Clostridia bacterium]
MKITKLLSVLLAALFVLTAAQFVSAEKVTVTKYKNIALNKSYTNSNDLYTAEPPTMDYQVVDGKEFTDGKIGSGSYDGEWVAFDKRKMTGGAHTITIDLGKTESGIGKLSLILRHAASDGVGLPSFVDYYVSDDGTNFTKLGAATKVDDPAYLTYEYVSETAGISGRYMRASFGGATTGVFVFVCEFEVGVPDGSEEVVVPVDSSTIVYPLGGSGMVTDEDGYLLGCMAGTSAADAKNMFCCGPDCISIVTADDKERTGNVVTGDRAVRTENGRETGRSTIIVDGDTSSNGKIDTSDYAMIKRHYLKTYTLNALQTKAGDINRNGRIDAADYAMVKRHFLGTYSIYSRYYYKSEEKPVLYENEMTFTRVSDTLLRMQTTYKGKALSLTFDKKNEKTPESTYSGSDWGTWNIGTFTFDGHAMAGGGTDWEYVYRANSTSASNWVWSGGNHGCEKFLSIEFYDAETGEKKDLKSNGDSFKTHSVKIVEKTHLHWGDPDVWYAEVTRTYTVAGTRIELEVDYNYVKDSYFFMSYTCMFPIHKTYGRHSRIYNVDGTSHDSYTTDGTVYPAYSNHYDSGNKSMHVMFWGDTYPDWKFDVEVYTLYDSLDNFSNTSKTMIWDMNASSDKLYFSKYESNTASMIKAGERRHTKSSWTFRVDD